MSLFKQVQGPKQTQLVYEATYYPAEKLNPFHKVVWSKLLYLRKSDILDRLEDGQLYHPGAGMFPIGWLYQNTPTELEWEKFDPLWKFKVWLRISPLIANGGRIALLEKL